MKIAGIMLAGLIACFILAPFIVANQWHTVGPWFTGLVGGVAQLVAPSQRIVAVGTLVFTPQTEVTVTSACNGLVGIRTFSMIFAVVFFLNWRSLAKPKFVAIYLSAIVVLWCQNLARVAIAIVAGRQTHFGTSEIAIAALAVVIALVGVAARHRLPRTPSLPPQVA